VLNGDWARLVTTGAAFTLSVRSGAGPCGVFLDPPYADTAERVEGLYACDSLTVAHDVRAWCLEHGDDARYRIVLAGFDGEHGDALTDAGWTVHEWFASGYLRGGFGDQQHRERLWASPHCLSRRYASDSLFGGAA
jgi:DNA adenine methylase